MFNRKNTTIKVIAPAVEGICDSYEMEVERNRQSQYFTSVVMPGNRKFLISLDGKVELPDNKGNRNFVGSENIVTLVVPVKEVKEETVVMEDDNNNESEEDTVKNNIPKKYIAKALVIESGKVVVEGVKTPIKVVSTLKANREAKKMAKYDAIFEELQARAEAMANSAG